MTGRASIGFRGRGRYFHRKQELAFFRDGVDGACRFYELADGVFRDVLVKANELLFAVGAYLGHVAEFLKRKHGTSLALLAVKTQGNDV